MSDSTSASRDAAAANYVDIQHHTSTASFVEALSRWLSGRLGPSSSPRIFGLDESTANGMSSDTVLFDASWDTPAGTRSEAFVARIAPSGTEIPVFPRYNLAQQYRTIDTVARNCGVPVPRLWWCEDDPAVLGRPFFLMSRVSGDVPPDVLPYTFGDNWVFDGTTAQRAAMQTAMVKILADLASIEDAPRKFAELELTAAGSTPLERHLSDVESWYRWTLDTNPRSTLIEQALERLRATVPADPGETVLSWGDARIGNVLFDGFEPAAVLDWEMAVLGPRELDLAWLVYSHRVFQDLAVGLGAEGLPDFLRTDDVAGAYESATGTTVRHLDWHLLFAATRWGIVFLRTGARQAAVSSQPLPDDGDQLLHNRPSLEQLLAGTYQR